MLLRRHSVCGMLILSLTGNRIRDTPVFALRRFNFYIIIIHAFTRIVNLFSLFFRFLFFLGELFYGSVMFFAG